MAKWYMTPDNIEFSQWSPRSFAQYVNSTAKEEEPSGKHEIGGKVLYPLIDNGPTIPDGHVVDARTVTVGADTATAAYTYRDQTAEEIAEEVVRVSDAINAERNRRVLAGFAFGGTVYDFDDRAKANISGAAQLAFMAIIAGAQVGDLRWHGGASDFAWITADNSIVTMDAQTVVNFGKAAAEHEQGHIFAARSLKDADPIPSDFTDDAYWP